MDPSQASPCLQCSSSSTMVHIYIHSVFFFMNKIKQIKRICPCMKARLSGLYALFPSLACISVKFSTGLLECNDAAASSAVHAVADAVCNCRFEFSEMAADEVVIAKILLVLLAAVRCPAGRFLNASTVKNILEATFRIGHNGRESELLQRSARQTLLEITRAIFCRVSKAARERVQATDADNVSIDSKSY